MVRPLGLVEIVAHGGTWRVPSNDGSVVFLGTDSATMYRGPFAAAYRMKGRGKG